MKFEDAIVAAKEQFYSLKARTRKVEEENARLKDEIYSNKEVERLSDMVFMLKRKCSQYGLPDAKYKKLTDWKEFHTKVKEHNDYVIEISETEAYIEYKCKCRTCNDEMSAYLNKNERVRNDN